MTRQKRYPDKEKPVGLYKRVTPHGESLFCERFGGFDKNEEDNFGNRRHGVRYVCKRPDSKDYERR